jgi:ABC-2 type transport system ATP-binding protein
MMPRAQSHTQSPQTAGSGTAPAAGPSETGLPTADVLRPHNDTAIDGPVARAATGTAAITVEPAVLQVDAVRFSFGPRRVLRGLTLDVRAREILVLLGPNGAGKSTLVKAMAGRLRMESGTVRVDGRDPLFDPEARRLTGIVPQQIALFEKLTALENLISFGRLMGMAKAPSKSGDILPTLEVTALATLDRVGLKDRAHDRVQSLSGGMRRRINIAAALMHGPKILVLDEPTVGLDQQARAGLAQLLRDLKSSGLAILLTTHDMEEAEALADRVAIMVAGRVKAEGAPRALVTSIFGAMRQLTLSVDPDVALQRPQLIAALLEAGLQQLPDGRTWSGLVASDKASFDAIVRTALAVGAAIGEVRVRQPGLDAVMARVVDDDKGAR